MKRITAFIGSVRKKGTYLAVQEFEKNPIQKGIGGLSDFLGRELFR